MDGEEDDEERFLPEFPFVFRIGAMGFGAGVGCGIGIGFGGPLNLGGIPAVGSAVSGMSAGVGQISHMFGGALNSGPQAVRSLGIKGLDAGAGCGVGIGYGFGAGLMLKPTAIDTLCNSVRHAAGWVTKTVQLKLQGAEAVAETENGAGSAGTLQATGQDQLLRPAMATGRDASSQLQAMFSPRAGPSAASSELAHQQPEMVEVMRTLLRQQAEISQLQRQSRSLRKAVCMLDPLSAVCRLDVDDDDW